MKWLLSAMGGTAIVLLFAVEAGDDTMVRRGLVFIASLCCLGVYIAGLTGRDDDV